MTKPETEMRPNGFLAVLQQKETQVEVLTELSTKLAEAVKAAAITGKKAKITLALIVEPKLDALNFVTKITSLIPVEEEPLCIFYTDTEGNLYRNDPRQKELALSSHDGGKTPSVVAMEAQG